MCDLCVLWCLCLVLLFKHTKTYAVAINSRLREALPCDSACFQMAGRVSPPLLYRGEGFASPSLVAIPRCMLHILPSGARLTSLPVSEPWNYTDVDMGFTANEWMLFFSWFVWKKEGMKEEYSSPVCTVPGAASSGAQAADAPSSPQISWLSCWAPARATSKE